MGTIKSDVAEALNANLGEVEARDRLAKLEAENAELRARAEGRGSSLRCKVSEKGGVSVYGLGRFPVTLYLEQWTRLLDAADEIRTFIEANRGALKVKDGGS